jgi:hypothetical protein
MAESLEDEGESKEEKDAWGKLVKDLLRSENVTSWIASNLPKLLK